MKTFKVYDNKEKLNKIEPSLDFLFQKTQIITYSLLLL